MHGLLIRFAGCRNWCLRSNLFLSPPVHGFRPLVGRSACGTCYRLCFCFDMYRSESFRYTLRWSTGLTTAVDLLHYLGCCGRPPNRPMVYVFSDFPF